MDHHYTESLLIPASESLQLHTSLSSEMEAIRKIGFLNNRKTVKLGWSSSSFTDSGEVLTLELAKLLSSMWEGEHIRKDSCRSLTGPICKGCNRLSCEGNSGISLVKYCIQTARVHYLLRNIYTISLIVSELFQIISAPQHFSKAHLLADCGATHR